MKQPSSYVEKVAAAVAAIDKVDGSMFYVKEFTVAEFGYPVAVVTWNSETAEYDVAEVRHE